MAGSRRCCHLLGGTGPHTTPIPPSRFVEDSVSETWGPGLASGGRKGSPSFCGENSAATSGGGGPFADLHCGLVGERDRTGLSQRRRAWSQPTVASVQVRCDVTQAPGSGAGFCTCCLPVLPRLLNISAHSVLPNKTGLISFWPCLCSLNRARRPPLRVAIISSMASERNLL